MKIPVALYMGILGGGKTSQIRRDLLGGAFSDRSRLLLIQCEDGEVRLDDDFLREHRVSRAFVLDPRMYTRTHLAALAEETQADGVILENQGIWPLQVSLRELPREWEIRSAVFCADATAFQQEFQNMDRLMAEKIRVSQKLLFHSAAKQAQGQLRAMLTMFQGRTEICFLP